jgi:hypothetical protein
MSLLASFTPNWRLIQDSSRSPSCAHTDNANAMTAIVPRSTEPNRSATATATTIAPSAPAIAPAQVFFGLIATANLGPPIARPAK